MSQSEAEAEPECGAGPVPPVSGQVAREAPATSHTAARGQSEAEAEPECGAGPVPPVSGQVAREAPATSHTAARGQSEAEAEPASKQGWTDSHCHLYDERLGPPDESIAEAHAAGVTSMIVIGCDRETSLAARQVAAGRPGVYATVGLHPHEARHGVATIADLVGPDTVAIGECGLDYHYDHSPRPAQREAFAAQIELANRAGLPVVVHTREAWDDTFDILDSVGVPNRLVFHCFTGGPVEARRALDLGAFLSFSGIVTFGSASDVREAAQLCPGDRMLVETDSPYLAPVPHRGKRNRPAWVPLIGACLAELRGTTAANICATSAAASRHAFPAIG